MTTLEALPSNNLTDRADELAERLFAATIGTLELYSVHVGRRLGLYEILADGRPRTVEGLAAEAGIAQRYTREWLEQQAVAGLLDAHQDDGSRHYTLGSDHARVLAAADDSLHVAPFASMVAGIGQALPDVVDAYRTGAGVPYVRYGSDFRDGQGGINRPAFVGLLGSAWLPSVQDVHARLLDGVRVADVGCGHGWSTQALARAYPNSEVVGIDVDEASIREARMLVPDDLAGRVRFEQTAAADLDGIYDVVLVLEALHDFGRPIESLAGIRAALADNGDLIVVDERVAESFTAPGDDIERMMFGWSAVHCLPVAVADGDHGAHGTALRPDAVREIAAQAGFADVEILPIDDELFRFYRLTP